MCEVRKREKGENEKETERGRRKRQVECIIKEESWQNRVLDNFACQFYIIENESEKERERKGKRN